MKLSEIACIGRDGTLVPSCPYFGTVFRDVLTCIVWLSHNPTNMQIPSLKEKTLRQCSSMVYCYIDLGATGQREAHSCLQTREKIRKKHMQAC